MWPHQIALAIMDEQMFVTTVNWSCKHNYLYIQQLNNMATVVHQAPLYYSLTVYTVNNHFHVDNSTPILHECYFLLHLQI